MRRFILRRRAQRDSRGAAALIIAFSMVSLLIVGGLVLDFGIVRVDRQEMKLAADDAVTAGLRAGDKGGTRLLSEQAVCGALAFLKANKPDLSTLQPNNCATPSTTVQCSTSSPFVYSDTVTLSGRSYVVTISSPFAVNNGTFPEDALTSLASDNSSMSGCDQVGVIIKASRKPGFGSVADPSDLVTTVRSVGRSVVVPGASAPAMLLLRRSGCPILKTGSASADSSWIHVYGGLSYDDKVSQAGTIHADSTGVGCGSDSVFQGRATNGIVAYAAPTPGSPGVPDAAKPGLLTSVAGLSAAIGTVRDNASYVYSSSALDETTAGAAAKGEPTGRELVTRSLIDERYLSGVKSAMSSAWSGVFSSGQLSKADAILAGYKAAKCDGGGKVTASDMPATPLTAADKFWVDCTNNNGLTEIPQINAGTVVFNGKVNPSATVSMPNATHVYVFGSSSEAILLNAGGSFSMHTAGNIDSATGRCKTGINAGSKAVLMVKDGQFKETNGGTLRLCNTTVIMMSGQSDGCTPSLTYLAANPVVAPAPTSVPCGGGTTMGSGQLTQPGGLVDWTAPNQAGANKDDAGNYLAGFPGYWQDPTGPEDLAFWSESGTNASTTFNMAGSSQIYVRGVFMAPNAQPFILSGGSSLDLRNAQYIATSVELNGAGTKVKMGVDPYSAVTLPELAHYLVR